MNPNRRPRFTPYKTSDIQIDWSKVAEEQAQDTPDENQIHKRIYALETMVSFNKIYI